MKTPKQLAVEFCETTTAHGFSRLPQQNLCRQLFWVVLILGGFVGFSLHTFFIVFRYLNYPKVLEEQVLVDKFLFPDVTFCPTNAFTTTIELEELVAFWKNARQLNANFQDERADETLAAFSLRYHAYRNSGSIYRPIEKQVVFCQFQGKLCNYTHFKVYKHPSKFQCFTFVPPKREMSTPGAAEGLHVMLHNPEDETKKGPMNKLEQFEFIPGYEIHIHPARTRPVFSRDKIIAQLGHQTRIGVTMSQSTSLPTPKFYCETNDTWLDLVMDHLAVPKENQSFLLTLDDCLAIRVQEEMTSRCGCQDDTLISPVDLASYPLCHQLPDFFVGNTVFAYHVDLYALVNQLNKTRIMDMMLCYRREKDKLRTASQGNLGCKRPCRSTAYSRMSSSHVIAKDHNNMANYVPEQLFGPPDYNPERDDGRASSLLSGGRIVPTWRKEDTASVKVFPVTLNVLDQTESLSLPLSELFSALGGIIGLWVGLSIMTLGELFEFSLRLVLSVLGCSCLRRQKKAAVEL